MFSIKYIRRFNPDLHKISDILINEHIKIHKKNIITCQNDFYNLYSDFDILYYKYFNEDLSIFNNLELMIHYHNHGRLEKRIHNKNIYLKIYNNFYRDIPKFKKNNLELILHLKKMYSLNEEIILFKIYEIIQKLEKNIYTNFNYNISNKIKELYKINISKNFDYIFYKNTYKDLEKSGLKNFEDYYNHYLNYGKSEGRKCNLSNMITFYNLSLLKSKYEINNKILNKKENIINILIRTCYRPNYFRKCIESILKQNYVNYNIIICYDDKKCESYLKEYKQNNISKFFIQLNNSNKYKFNLYCNHLLDKVKDGWILFLDDDDKLVDNNCFKIINDKIENVNDFIIWSFLRPDKIIKTKNIKNIELGEIDTTSFLFNSKYKKKALWDDQQNGDYRFVNKILSNNNFNIKIIDKIITCTIFDNKIANYGE